MQGLIKPDGMLIVHVMRGKRNRGKSTKRLWLKITLGALSCMVLSLVLVSVLLNTMISEELLVEKLEQTINSEVQIGHADISLFSHPARLSLQDVVLSAKAGDKHAGQSQVKIQKVDLSVSLWQLLGKRVEISQMTVHGASIRGTVYDEGGVSLQSLFQSPKEAAERLLEPDQAEKRKPPVNSEDVNEGSKNEDESEGGFNVFDQQTFIASLGVFLLEDSSVDLTFEESGLRVRCEKLNIGLSALEIDPQRLEDTDTAKLSLSVAVKLDSTKGWHYGDLFLDGDAEVRLFNQESGEMEPDVTGVFALSEASWLNTHVPVIAETWQQLRQLERLGLKISPLPEKAFFGRSESVAAHYHLGKITVQKPLSIWVGDWEVAALSGSWLQTESNQHEIHSEVLASEVASRQFEALILGAFGYLPDEVRDLMVADMQNHLFRQSRLFVKVKSQDSLSDPKIRLVDGVPDFAKSAEEAGKKLLKEKAGGLLDGLFGR